MIGAEHYREAEQHLSYAAGIEPEDSDGWMGPRAQWHLAAADRRVEQLADPTPTPDELGWAEVKAILAEPDHGYTIPHQKGHSE